MKATICILLAAAGLSSASPIGGLDLVSSSSTFETNGTVSNPLPFYGWTNVSGSARVFDWSTTLNGAMIGTTPYGNYEVQYITGVAVQPNTTYKLSVDVGYIAALTAGNSSYSLQLGTIDAFFVFTPLVAASTGSAAYAGDMSSGPFSGSETVTATTGAIVSGDILTVRWAQTGTLGSPFSDYFGFDNVLLEATPEPLSGLTALGGIALLWLRRRDAIR